MKKNPDEALDQWVRQSLSRLPDTPPPGSSFDAERLWQQMRPDLQANQSSQRTGRVWWMAAAVVTGLLMIWVYLYRSDDSAIMPVVTKKQEKKEERAMTPPVTLSADAGQIVRSKPVQEHKDPREMVEKTVRTKQPTVERPVSEPIEEGVDSPPTETIVAVNVTLPGTQHTTKVGQVKPRYKIVHENELRAEDEARPQLYQTGNFVRLGTGYINDSKREEPQPTLSIPLTSKSNQ